MRPVTGGSLPWQPARRVPGHETSVRFAPAPASRKPASAAEVAEADEFSARVRVAGGDRPALLAHAAPKAAYGKILVATDFSPASREAARIALLAAPAAQLVFLHVWQLPEGRGLRAPESAADRLHARREAAQRAAVALDRFVDGLGTGARLVSRVVRPGRPATVIGDYALLMGADLIVIGKRRVPRLKDCLFGSAARRLMRRTCCDLLTVPPPPTRNAPGRRVG